MANSPNTKTLSVGDIVWLNSNRNFPMTVIMPTPIPTGVKISNVEDSYTCQWLNSTGELQTAAFPSAVLSQSKTEEQF